MSLSSHVSLVRSSLPLVAALALLLAACSDGSGPAPGGGADASDTTDAPPDIPPGTFQVEWGPLEIPPGTEDVRCVTVRMGNAQTARIHEIHNQLRDLSHHYIIYTTPETEESLEPTPCDSIQNLLDPANGLPLMITQKYEERLTLPPGVAFTFEPDQMLRLELHYINASDTPIQAHVTSTFTSIAESEFQHAADMVFIGNPDIDIPAGQNATLGPTYIPMYAEFTDAKFFGFTGHQHQWGTNVTVSVAESETGPDTMVYDLPDFNWDEPETVYLEPPISFPEAGGFRFTCEWNNQSNSTVRFGEGVNDEMCFFWAYYYPATGIKTCFHTDQTPSPTDVCCPGSPLCALIDDYLGQ